jgi:vitamin B12 transporter
VREIRPLALAQPRALRRSAKDALSFKVIHLVLGRFGKICCSLLSFHLVAASIAWSGEIADSQSLDLFANEGTEVSTSRTPRPTSRSAENVTVISAEQIAELNAHTLAEVLNTVPGFQLEQQRTPGSWTGFSLQGAVSTHVQLLVDGIAQNNLLAGQTDPGLIPVQQIERVEIIKGAASAAWGSALGGVVNVITKSPDPGRTFGGNVYSSIGERFSSDLHAEASGTTRGVGYYLSGGNLHSDGLLPNNGINHTNLYLKLAYELPRQGNLTFGFNISQASRGIEETERYHDDTRSTRGYSFLNLSKRFNNLLSFEFAGWLSRDDTGARYGDRVAGGVIASNDFQLREATRGASTKLVLGDSSASLVTGVEYEHGATRQWDRLAPNSPFLTDRAGDRWSVYGNGAYSLGPLTLLPGIRLDHTVFNDDALSYTLGAACNVTEKTVVRGYFARGYSLANALWNNGLQKVWTVQGGVETGEIPFLWLKGSLFYNDTWNVEVFDYNPAYPGATLRSQIRQGFELEARSTPVYGVFLAGGYTFTDARDQQTGGRLNDVPEHGVKLSLHFDDKASGLRGVVTGNLVRWNAAPVNNARYDGFLWDLSLTKKFLTESDRAPELFFSVHNLLDGAQYLNGNFYPNTGRWMEGGARFTF